MPRVRVGWIFVAVVFFSVFKEEITADVADLPADLTQIDAENLDGHVEISTLDVLPTTTPEQEHSTTHNTKKFLKWPSRRPLFKKHNGRDSTLKTNELSSTAASQESYPKEMDSTIEIQEQTTPSAETTPAKLYNRGSYRFIPPKSSLPSGHSSSTTTTELPPYTKVTFKASSAEKFASTPKFRKFLMRRKLESPSHSSPNRALKLETSVNSGIVTGAVEVSSKHQENLLKKGGEVVELTKALLESEQNDEENFFKETGTETDETLFESGDPAESDLFEIDQNYNKFLMTEKPLEKVTVLLPASFNVEDLKTNRDLEEAATMSSDIQHPNEEVEGITITTTKYVDKSSNLEVTVSSKTNPVDEIHIGNSAGASFTTTTEHDKLSRLHKFLNNKSRYHSRARFGSNVNENSTKYLNITTTEYTTIQNNAEPEYSTIVQPTENSLADTISTKRKVPFMHKHLNLKHENSIKIHLADATVEEKLTENHATAEHNKVLHMHQLVDEKSKGPFTSQRKESSLEGNSTDVNIVTTKHLQIIHTHHRLPHMEPKNPIMTPTENSIDRNSSDKNKNLVKHDLEESVTIFSAIQHPNEKDNEGVEEITFKTIKYIDGNFNSEATGTTVNPVDEVFSDNSADETSTTTTTEHDKLSRLYKFHKSSYYTRAGHNDNVNENPTKYSDRITTVYTTIKNNAGPEDSTTMQPTTKHKISYMHRHLKHENSTKIHLADATVEEKLTENHATTEHNKVLHKHQLVDEKSEGSFTSQLKESSLNKNSTDVKIVQHPQIIHMHRLPHMKLKKPTITSLTENSIHETSSDVIENLAKHDLEEGVTMSSDVQHPNEKGKAGSKGISITTTKYVDETFNFGATDTIGIPVDEIIEHSADETSTTTERDRLSRLHKFLNKKSRYHSRASFDNNANENSTRYFDRTTTEFTTIENNAGPEDSTTMQPTTKHKISYTHRHLKHENSTKIHLADATVEEKLTENHATTEHNKVLHKHQLVDEKSEGSFTSQLKESSLNKNSTDVKIVQHPQIIHMHRLPHMKLKKPTITSLTENSIHETSSDVIENLAKHDLEEGVTMSSDVQHPNEKGKAGSKGISITTTKYVDETFNFGTTDTIDIPVDEIIEHSADETSTTTERDRLSRLHKFLNKKSRYHSRASFDNNANENSTRYFDRTTTEFTTIENNAETDSTTIQMTENSYANTTRIKPKIPFIHKHLSLKHENSTEIHFADTAVEEKLSENYATTEHYKVLPTHQLADEKSKGPFTSLLRGSSQNSTHVNIGQTKHPQIIHMHRLPHMKPKIPTITSLTENSIHETSSDVIENLAKHDLEEGVTMSSDVQHPNEEGNAESEGISITTTKYVDENFEASFTTDIPVDRIIEDYADTTSTSITTEHDKLSRLHKFLNKKSRYHSRANFDNDVNENFTRYLDTTTSEYTTIQNNARPEDSTTVQPTENNFADTTSTKHKIPHMNKYLDLKHEHSTRIHHTNVDEQPTENVETTDHKKIPHMNHLVQHKNSTITHLTENSINETSSEHKIIRMRKYPNWKHNNFTSSHLIGNSATENSTDANHVIEQNKTFAVPRIMNINQKNFTETKHKSTRIQKYLNVIPNNAPVNATQYSDNRDNDTSDDENIVATHKIIHMPRLLNIAPNYLSETHIIENGVNESSVDEITTSPEHKIIHMPKSLDMEHRNSTAMHRVFENSVDGNTRERHEIIHTQNLHTKPKTSITTDSTEKSDNESPVDANIAPIAHKVIHRHKFLDPILKNVTSTLITEKKEIDYNKMIHMKQLLDVKPSTYPAESSVEEIYTDASTVRTQGSEATRKHQYLNEKPEESRYNAVRVEETKKTLHENIQTTSSTQKAQYSTKSWEIEITQTPDYTSTIIEEITDENSDRVIESTSEEEITGSTNYVYEEITTSPDISIETDHSSEISDGTTIMYSVPSIRTATTEISELISSTERPIVSTRYNNEKITTDSKIYTDGQVPLRVSTETSSSSIPSPTSTSVRDISNTQQYIDGEVTTSVPLQQGMRNKSTIPRRHYLFKRTTTTSPIITGQESGQEETVTEGIITSAIIHLQVHNETGSLLLNPPMLAETTTFDDADIGNEDVTDELYSAEISTETFSLATENANDSNDATENSEGTLVTLDPADWYGVNTDITTEVPADEMNTDFDEIDADIDEEKTSIVVHSIGSETANTTTIVKASTKQREPLANNEGTLDDTSESVEIQELVTVDRAHWYGVEYGTESGEKVEAAIKNTTTLNYESETETEQSITVGDTTSGSVMEIDSRFGGNVNFTNEIDLLASVSNNVEGVMENITTEEISTTGVTVITQNETTVGESLLTKMTTDKTDRNESRNTIQSGLEDNHSDHQQELYESKEIEIRKGANISSINKTIILEVNDKIESTIKKSPSLSSEVMSVHDKVSTSSPNVSFAENINDLPKSSDVQVTIIRPITSKNGAVSLGDAVSKLSKTGDKLTEFTETSKLPSSNSSKIGTEYEKHVEVNTVHLEVGSEFNTEINITKLKIPVTETLEADVSVLEKVQSSEVALQNTIGSEDIEDKKIELGTEQRKMLFEKLGEVFESNENMTNVSNGVKHNGPESASFNISFTIGEVDEEVIEDDEETEEDGAVESEYMDLYAIDRKNHKIQDVQQVSYVAKNILGNPANFSVQVKMKQQTIQMPSDVHISEDPKHLVLNFTWPSSENTYNYSLSLHLNESAGRYLINKMLLNFVKDDITVKESEEHQGKDESFVDLGDDIQVIFSNTDFLKISKVTAEDETSEDYKRATKERQARVLHMEIILGAVIVIGVIVLVIYILIARRRKLRSPIVEDKDVSSRL